AVDAPTRAVSAFPLRRSHAIAAAVALVVLLAIVIIAASSGGGSKLDVKPPSTVLQPAPTGAPVNQQLDRLERIVRAEPRKR
ncbi:MAG TPA: hypothetical protein VH300_11575, partial [Thermoleophilaceae bacterium]|nr:hypothetical protein [Thermoleophilaceae bacterium]